MSRERDLVAHFSGGKTICPYARAGLIATMSLGNPSTSFDLAELVRARALVVTFRRRGDVLEARASAVLVASHDPPDHAEARRVAEHMFALMAVACAWRRDLPWQPGGEAANAAPQTCRDGRDSPFHARALEEYELAKQSLQHPHLRPVLAIDTRLTFTIAMGPQYSPQHPRYAPHLCLVTTWMADVVEMMQTRPEVSQRIHDAMAARTGSVYDAAELYLEEG